VTRRTTIRPVGESKLVSGPAIGAPDHDEHAQMIEADERFQAALDGISDEIIIFEPERFVTDCRAAFAQDATHKANT
jgi:hypothetical protein